MSCRNFRNKSNFHRGFRDSDNFEKGSQGTSGTGKLYRSRNSMFLGVCSGIARWRDLPVSLVRFGVVMLAFFTGIFPVLIGYIIVGLILETEPKHGESQSYRDFSQNYKENKQNVADDIRTEYESIKRRVSRMENDAVNREQDWEDRFRSET